MSKKKHKDDCCCCCCTPCCCNSCCNSNYLNTMNNGYGNMGNWGNGILEAVIFWLIACGAGLLNTSSILIILLFLLYGWSCDGSGIFGW